MKLINISKKYNNNIILDNINIELKQGKILSILGPSGCGKTTLLNIIAGLVDNDTGKLNNIKEKKISYVFQEPRLLNNITVYENIKFVLNDISNDNMELLINEYLKETGLLEYKNYYPEELSGGMKQRVSLVRAFVYQSDIILMDEPFRSLDLQLRLNLIDYFKKLWERDKRTIIFVTHDITTSILLGDDICILSNKPTTVKKSLVNPVTYYARKAFNDGVLAAEKEISSYLLNN
jgi:NitT/TauT family transport system ATP-binding protein